MRIIRWEYLVKTITRNNPKDLEISLNKMGEMGWDVASSIVLYPDNGKIGITVLILKRPLTYIEKETKL